MSTSILLNFNGTNGSTTFTDEGPLGLAVTAFGNAQLSTTSPAFGSASLRLDGTGDRISVANNAALQLGGGQFTVECFVNLDSTPTGTDRLIVGLWRNSVLSWIFVVRPTTRKIGWYWSTNGTSGTFTPESTNAIPLTTWTHIAATRDASNHLRLFVNGVKGYDAVHAATYFAATDAMGIGGQLDGNGIMAASYIDMLRIKKGECLYTADFTPPSAEFAEPKTVAAPPRAFPRSILHF